MKRFGNKRSIVLVWSSKYWPTDNLPEKLMKSHTDVSFSANVQLYVTYSAPNGLLSGIYINQGLTKIITKEAKLLNADWLKHRIFFLNHEVTFANQEGTITWSWLAFDFENKFALLDKIGFTDICGANKVCITCFMQNDVHVSGQIDEGASVLSDWWPVPSLSEMAESF